MAYKFPMTTQNANSMIENFTKLKVIDNTSHLTFSKKYYRNTYFNFIAINTKKIRLYIFKKSYQDIRSKCSSITNLWLKHVISDYVHSF